MSRKNKFLLRRLAVYVVVIGMVIAICYLVVRSNNNASATARNDAEIAQETANRELGEARALKESARLTCEGTNQVRTDFLSSLDQQLQRSAAALAATQASPSATDLQKAVAQRNFDSAKAFLDDLHNRADPQRCPKKETP